MENNWNRPKDYTNQRDTFIGDLFQIAKQDKDVILISIDMGASALDQWREELPEQFIWTGISEQHTINLAAGLANQGKKVYIYFMAAWLARCFEQIRYSCAMAKNPITLLANGVALGYAPAGPAHETNDDIAYMRSILDLEIHCPTNLEMVKTLVNLTYEEPKLRCIRLERHYATDFDGCYNNPETNFIEKGIHPVIGDGKKVALLSYGFMLGRMKKVTDWLIQDGEDVALYDVFKLKPMNSDLLKEYINDCDYVVTCEEQTLSGGFGSIICETLADIGLQKNILRIGLPDRYIFENGDRNYLLNNNGLSVESIYNKVSEFVNE